MTFESPLFSPILLSELGAVSEMLDEREIPLWAGHLN
jgi:hypothetical protein